LINDWDGYRLVLAIARLGSLTKAAKDLGVNHSTIFRNLTDIEQKWGTRLFDRLPGGQYHPTHYGQRVADAAERMEEETLTLQRDLTGRDHHLSGQLKVTSSETLAYRLLTKFLAEFQAKHPGIGIELSIDSRILSLSRHEADISLRAMRPTENHLWGRKMSDIAWAIYGAKDYVKKYGVQENIESLSGHPFIGWDLNASNIAAADWVNNAISPDTIIYRTNSLLNQMNAAKNKIGLATLPCYLGDPEPGLARMLSEPLTGLSRELWIVTHSDLKDTARVRAFFDIVGSRIVAHKKLFLGLESKMAR